MNFESQPGNRHEAQCNDRQDGQYAGNEGGVREAGPGADTNTPEEFMALIRREVGQNTALAPAVAIKAE